MKTAILTIAYKEEWFIKHFINHYKSLVDKILVMHSTTSYMGEQEFDETGDIARSMGVEVIPGSWKRESIQRNAGLEHLKEYDIVFILDPDEYFTKSTFKQLVSYLSNNPGCAWAVPVITYWKKDHKLYPNSNHYSTIAVSPSKVEFTSRRMLQVAPTKLHSQYILHHFTWTKSRKDILRKVRTYSHANEFNGDIWMKQIWDLPCHELTQAHPTNKGFKQKAVPCEYPEELRHLVGGLNENLAKN